MHYLSYRVIAESSSKTFSNFSLAVVGIGLNVNLNCRGNINLPKNTTGVVIMEISKDSPLMFVSVNDVIVELQKKKISSSKQLSGLVKEIIKKGSKTLYLAIYDSNNQRSYITVKLK